MKFWFSSKAFIFWKISNFDKTETHINKNTHTHSHTHTHTHILTSFYLQTLSFTFIAVCTTRVILQLTYKCNIIGCHSSNKKRVSHFCNLIEFLSMKYKKNNQNKLYVIFPFHFKNKKSRKSFLYSNN